jgi:hypothetical protein
VELLFAKPACEKVPERGGAGRAKAGWPLPPADPETTEAYEDLRNMTTVKSYVEWCTDGERVVRGRARRTKREGIGCLC